MSNVARTSGRGVRTSAAVVGLVLALAVLILGLVAARGHSEPAALLAELTPPVIPADGHSTMLLRLHSSDGRSLSPTQISLHFSEHASSYHVDSLSPDGNGVQAKISAGILPGTGEALVRTPHLKPVRIHFSTEPDYSDRFADGTPDFLRLDSPADRDAFRRWFTLLAEVEASQPTEKLPAEISDCAGLIRFAYREALSAHDPAWMAQQQLRTIPGIASVEKYQYPYTPLGAALWRVQPGSFQSDDLTSGAFAQFADAKTLKNLNMHFISKDLRQAHPGDILFYRQLQQNSPYHSMVFIGPSQLQPELRDPLVIYHTGSIGKSKGEIRVLRLSDLMNFPAPRWRPLEGNSNFLGVYRWNILKEAN